MGRLRHRTSPGCTYFITTDTWQNREIFRVSETAEIVTQRITSCRDQGAYLLHEFVVMPNHLHLLLTPAENASLERSIQLIKGGSSHKIHQQRGHRMQIWQSGFHDWTVRDVKDYRTKCEYIRLNSVRAGLVERPEDWPYGSASGRFRLDPMPGNLAGGVILGAKARDLGKTASVGAEALTP